MLSVLKIKYGYPSLKIPNKYKNVFECTENKIHYLEKFKEKYHKTVLLQTEWCAQPDISWLVPRIILSMR